MKYFWIAFSLIIVYLAFLVVEYFINKKSRKQLKHVIHINGIRGKSTVTRLIGTMLDRNEIPTLTKVTGTLPMVILDGVEKEIKRIGNPNIKEQLKVMRKAANNNVDALVIECMAVTPEYQKITEERMLNASITIITNARLDHEEVMGDTKENIINSLGKTIPSNGYLVTSEELSKYYFEKANKNNTKIVTFDKFIRPQNIDLYDENIAIALAVASILEIPEEKALKSMENYPKDIGATQIFKMENHTFISAFSINDNDSLNHTLKLIEKEIGSYDNLTIIFNNRSDRQHRMKQQLKLIKNINPNTVIVAGSNYKYSHKVLKPLGINIIKYQKNMALNSHQVILGMGNVKGVGLQLIKHYNELSGH